MVSVDHPALVLKRRESIPRERDTISAEWRRSALADIARVPLPAIYRQAFERWRLLMLGTEAVATWSARCTDRLLVGAAGTNVLESGVALHHTYGVPYIPGSAVKGLCAHYASEVVAPGLPDWAGPPSTPQASRPPGDAYALAFGSTDDMGLLSFLDAWLVPHVGPTLLSDVLTPHHPGYYRNEPNAWPADWDSPVPMPFLSVRAEFFFAVEAPCDTAARKLRDFVVESIAKPALRDWGVGAKTAAGYGGLEVV